MTQALATRPQNVTSITRNVGRNSLAKTDMSELKELAEIFVQSGAWPDVKNAAQAMIKIMAGRELGFAPLVSMAGVHFFNGKVTVGATLIASLIKDSNKYEYKIVEHDEKACAVEFFQNINGELRSLGVPVRYTIEDAAKAQLTSKDNWKKYTKDMLFAACIRQGSRRYCADVLRGVTPDTDSDIDRSAIDETPVIESAAIEAQIVEEDDLTSLCSKLNAAGDSIVWTKQTLAEYAEEFNQKPLEEQNDEEIAALTADLRERLASFTP